MSRAMVLAARAVPLAGWAYLGYGLIRPPRSPLARALFWIDGALSVGAHAAQIPAAIRALEPLGVPRTRTALLTFVFGATWWRAERRERP